MKDALIRRVDAVYRRGLTWQLCSDLRMAGDEGLIARVEALTNLELHELGQTGFLNPTWRTPVSDRKLFVPGDFPPIADPVRQRIAAELRKLAEYRREYCNPCPETAGDFHDMHPMALCVHEEHATAEWLADIVEGKNDAMGWLPSWRWDDWRDFIGSKGTTK